MTDSARAVHRVKIATASSAAACRCGHAATDHEGDLLGRFPCGAVTDIAPDQAGITSEIRCECTAYIARGGT